VPALFARKTAGAPSDSADAAAQREVMPRVVVQPEAGAPAVVFIHGRGSGETTYDTKRSDTWLEGLNVGRAVLGLPPLESTIACIAPEYGQLLEEFKLAVGNIHKLPSDVRSELGENSEVAVTSGVLRRVISQTNLYGTPNRACLHCVHRAGIVAKAKHSLADFVHNEAIHRLGINTRMADVVQWLADTAVRQRIRSHVVEQIRRAGIRPAVMIGHSLGSLVMLDALAYEPDLKPDLLVTCGSPIALATIRERMDEKLAEFVYDPGTSWVNAFDPADIVTGGKWVKRSISDGVQNWHVYNRSKSHAIDRYLEHPPVVQAISATIQETDGLS
jgi:hypothetical protein